jgi:predicted lipase
LKKLKRYQYERYAVLCKLAYPKSVRRVVTFGQPATSYLKFHQQYLLHKRTFRICYDLDIVTFLPPLPGLFKHVGRSLWLHNERIYENARPIWRLYRVLALWLISPISYHYMHKYIRDKDFFDDH